MTPLTEAPVKRNHCAKCGADVASLAELAAVALRAKKALDSMRLALPAEATEGVKLLASSLRCTAGLCSPSELVEK